MSTSDQKDYVLGTRDEELARLGFQHRVWAAQAHALWERAGFAPGSTILDAGCGPGFATIELARLVGAAGRIIAADASEKFLDHLRRQLAAGQITNVQPTLVDVEKLDLPAGSLDGAYARWLLCFVRDPQAVVAAVARALRPGGVFAVQDYFNYGTMTLAPRSALCSRVVEAVCESWRQRGGDPDIVARLPKMMAACGLQVREIQPVLRVARPGSVLWDWPGSFVRIFVPTLVELGLLTRDEQTEFAAEWEQRSRDPHSFFFCPPAFDVIAVKE